jgi:hypothetical protein
MIQLFGIQHRRQYEYHTCQNGGTISDYHNFLRMTPELTDAGHIFGFNAWAKGDIPGNPAVMQAYEAGKNVSN